LELHSLTLALVVYKVGQFRGGQLAFIEELKGKVVQVLFCSCVVISAGLVLPEFNGIRLLTETYKMLFSWTAWVSGLMLAFHILVLRIFE
jgi:Na+/alanine symporter